MQAGDLLLVEASGEALEALVADAGLEAAGSGERAWHELPPTDIAIAEAVVMPDSPLRSQTVLGAGLRRRFRVNLLAISRRGRQYRTGLRETAIEAGDVLLLQADRAQLPEVLAAIGCLPLAERDLRVGPRERRVLLAISIFGGALLVAAAFRLLPIQVAIVGAAAMMGLVGLVSPKEVYESVDWSVIVLLGAMIPVGGALEDTGAAGRAAEALVTVTGGLPTWAHRRVGARDRDVPVRRGQQHCGSRADGADRVPRGRRGRRLARSTADGRRCRCVSCVPDPDRAPVQPAGHGAGRLPLQRLLAHGPALELVIAVTAVPLIMLVWPPSA